MSDELITIEKLVRKELHPENFIILPSDCHLKEWVNLVTEEKDRICKYFWNIATSGSKQDELAEYIKAYQTSLLNLTDILIGYTQDETNPVTSELKVFYLKVSTTIEDILIYIQQYLPNYFDENLPIPYLLETTEVTELSENLTNLMQLYNKAGVETLLLQVALNPIREFVTRAVERISYRQLRYLKELAKDLGRMLDLQEDIDINYELHTVLLQLNFNLPRYVIYCCDRLDNKLGKMTADQKQDTLSWYIRTMEEMQYKPGFIFIPGLPSVSVQIITFIKKTYKHLFTKKEIVSPEKRQAVKIKTNYSVYKMAAIIKIGIEVGDFKNEHAIDVIRVFAENFTSVKMEELSEGSLRGKYHNIDSATYQSLLETLDNWKNAIRKEINL